MIRKRDNPAPETDGGVTTFYGPAKNRAFWRVFELWCYAGIRHRATMSDFWFRIWSTCCNAMVMLDQHWVRNLSDPKCRKISEAVATRHEARHPIMEGRFDKFSRNG